MIIKTITRSYSRSVNTNSIHPKASESWVKSEATFTADCESTDNEKEVSKFLSNLAIESVSNTLNEVRFQIEKKYGSVNIVEGSTPNVPATIPSPRQL